MRGESFYGFLGKFEGFSMSELLGGAREPRSGDRVGWRRRRRDRVLFEIIS